MLFENENKTHTSFITVRPELQADFFRINTL